MCGCSEKKKNVVIVPYKEETMKVNGVLVSASDGEGVVASLVNKTQPTIGTDTDLKGNYQIEGNPSDIIEINIIGTAKKIVTKLKNLPSRLVLNDSETLNEVTVNALKHKKLGYALLVAFGLGVYFSKKGQVAKKVTV